MSKILQYMGDESGASAAEYALILALVAVAIILGLTALGGSINNVLTSVSGNIQGAVTGS